MSHRHGATSIERAATHACVQCRSTNGQGDVKRTARSRHGRLLSAHSALVKSRFQQLYSNIVFRANLLGTYSFTFGRGCFTRNFEKCKSTSPANPPFFPALMRVAPAKSSGLLVASAMRRPRPGRCTLGACDAGEIGDLLIGV